MKNKLPLILVSSALFVFTAGANPFTWTGSGETDQWTDAANWDTAPDFSRANATLNTYEFIFNSNSVQDMGDTTRRFFSLTFNGGDSVLFNGTGNIIIGSGGGGIIVNGGNQVINTGLFSINVFTANSNGGIIVNNGSLTLNASDGFSITGSSAPRYGVFSGNGDITLNGRLLANPQESRLLLRDNFSGTLTLQTAGSEAAGFTSHEGTGELRLAADDALGNMSLRLANNGARIASVGGKRTIANTVEVRNSFTLSGADSMEWSGQTDFSATAFTVMVANASAELIVSGTVNGASGVLAKEGAGTLVLAADDQSQWAQRIEIHDGGLRVEDSGASATGTGEVWIGREATLWGEGTIDGATEVLGTLRMGAGNGLNFGDGLTLGAESILLLEYGAEPVSVAGDLVLVAGATVLLDESVLWQVGETYTLFEIIEGDVVGALQIKGDYGAQFHYGDGVVSFTLTAIPEPRFVAALLGGVLLLLVMVRVGNKRTNRG